MQFLGNTHDLSWSNLYGWKVRFGAPRVVQRIGISETKRYELIEDTNTKARFIAPLECISACIEPGKSYIPYYPGADEVYKFSMVN